MNERELHMAGADNELPKVSKTTAEGDFVISTLGVRCKVSDVKDIGGGFRRVYMIPLGEDKKSEFFENFRI